MIATFIANTLLATVLLAAEPAANHQLICCGADEVSIVTLPESPLEKGVSEPVWQWRAVDSSLPDGAVKWFRSTDECKPQRDTILITSSSGGVALIQLDNKQCLFLAYAKNAHSACLLPENRLAVASSFGGDQLLIYSLKDAILKSDEAKAEKVTPAEPILSIPLVGAHGAVWDDSFDVLWALGSDVLLKLKIEPADLGIKLVTKRSWKLPSPGGHDLFPMNDGKHLFVTTNEHVYRFQKATGEFRKDPVLGDEPKVKSVTQHPTTGEIVYHQGAKETWWSNTIRFVGDRDSIKTDDRLYKIRWEIER